jgi:hypothetical protein
LGLCCHRGGTPGSSARGLRDSLAHQRISARRSDRPNSCPRLLGLGWTVSEANKPYAVVIRTLVSRCREAAHSPADLPGLIHRVTAPRGDPFFDQMATRDWTLREPPGRRVRRRGGSPAWARLATVVVATEIAAARQGRRITIIAITAPNSSFFTTLSLPRTLEGPFAGSIATRLASFSRPTLKAIHPVLG